MAILPYKTTKKRVPAKHDPTAAKSREQRVEQPIPSLSPSSPQEEKFWGTRGEPSRTLRFSENLLDEEVNLGDISTASFGSPLANPLPSLKVLGNIDLPDDPTITQFPKNITDDQEGTQPIYSQDPKLSSPDMSGPIVLDVSPTQSHRPNPVLSKSESKEDAELSTIEILTSKKKKIKVNIEVERIVVSESKVFRNRCTHQFLTQSPRYGLLLVTFLSLLIEQE